MGFSTCVLIVMGGQCGDRRRLAACKPWVGCRGERTGSRREIPGFVHKEKIPTICNNVSKFYYSIFM